MQKSELKALGSTLAARHARHHRTAEAQHHTGYTIGLTVTAVAIVCGLFAALFWLAS